MRAAFTLDPDAAIPVELELQLPLRAFGQFGNRETEHRFKETGFRVRRRIRHFDSIAQGGASDQIFGKGNDWRCQTDEYAALVN